MQLHLIFSNSQKSDVKLNFCGISGTMCLSFLRLNIIQIQQTVNSMGLKDYYLNPVQLSVAFHIEIIHMICNGNLRLNLV